MLHTPNTHLPEGGQEEKVYKKFITILKYIASEIIEHNDDFPDTLTTMGLMESDFPELDGDMLDLDEYSLLSDEELDDLKSLLAYIIVRDTRVDWEEVYTLVFGRGRRIQWH